MAYSDKRSPILVPHWIIKQLQRNGLPLGTVLDLKKLKQYCSQEDLAVMFNLNLNPGSVFGINHIRMELYGYWAAHSNSDFKSLSDVLPIHAGRLEERLFSTSSIEQVGLASSQDLDGKAFSIQNVATGLDEKDVLLVVIHAGYFGGPHSQKAQQQLVRAYLKQSYVFCSYDQVASDPVYLQYLCDQQAATALF